MLKKIRSLVSNSSPSYIECYDDALTNEECRILISLFEKGRKTPGKSMRDGERVVDSDIKKSIELDAPNNIYDCLLYTSPSPRDRQKSRMPSSA